MLEMMLRLRAGVLSDGEVLRGVLEGMCALPGFEAIRYDLNQQGSWRGFDGERMWIDAMTQRVQFMLIEGQSGDRWMLALGKHGEQPTGVYMGAVGFSQVEGGLGDLMRVEGVLRLEISDPGWRARFEGEAIPRGGVWPGGLLCELAGGERKVEGDGYAGVIVEEDVGEEVLLGWRGRWRELCNYKE